MLPFALMAIAFWGTVLGGGVYLARRLTRAAEARNGELSQLTELRERVTLLEDALEGARSDIERLETGQEFTTRLLGSRPATGEHAA